MKWKLSFFILLISSSALACKCVTNSIISEISHAKNIVEATLISKIESDQGIINYDFIVDKKWKGDLNKSDTLSITQGLNGCDKVNFEVQKEYILFSNGEIISQCVPSTRKENFKYYHYLENLDLIEKENILNFEKKGFLFFKRYAEVDPSIFIEHPFDSFYPARKYLMNHIPTARKGLFKHVFQVEIKHLPIYVNTDKQPSKRLLRFIEKKSKEREKILIERIETLK